ncbi:VCBS repeat-containing protein [Streptomyces fulvoviolaceus]|uniref:VCBS repeat-containing protein n=1 Tax=Streptomyces fulvoviolaceus TaxID=285535 RepID=UPI0021C0CA56|nr:VCBS repeat-containing protein [Streptomyces fulvoviolaceus]MCT9076788.1 VCBS repeat-containing protein [Streptomyces fulvoviolaceus]
MNKHRKAWGAGLAAAMTVTGAVVLPAAHAEPAEATAPAARQDFNGDGYEDLAVSASLGTVNGKTRAGYVAVLYGSATGLKTSTKQVFTQNSAGIPGSAETGDQFGSALTTADLDKDGFADLIVGVGGEDTADGGTNSGLVEVIWGSAKGLSGGASIGPGGEGDQLGVQGHLAVADVDGDGATDVLTVENQHDLAVTRGPFARDGSVFNQGQVVVDKYDSRVLDLAVGDLNGDGITDVAATENDGDEFDSRRVVYWYGTSQGLTPYTLVYDVDGAGLQGGESLDIGDVNKDGYDDIVVGRAVDGYDSDLDTYLAKGGRIAWIPGTKDGPDGVAATFFNQDREGVPGTAEKWDGFGTDVQVADVDGDGYEDVVTGVPGEDLGSRADAGAIVTLRGTAKGLSGTGSRTVTQNSAEVPGTAEKGDTFGRALHLGDTNGDGLADLAVGSPGENAGAGLVTFFLSGVSGVNTPGKAVAVGNSLLGTVATGARLGSGFAR